MDKYEIHGNWQEIRDVFFKWRELVREKKIAWRSHVTETDISYLTANIVYSSHWNQHEVLFVYGVLQRFQNDLRLFGIYFNRLEYPMEKKLEKEKEVSSHIGYNGESFVISFKYSAALVDQVKKHFPPISRKYNEKNKTWEIPITLIDQVKKFAEENDFKIGERALGMIYGFQENLEQSYSAERVELNLPMRKEMFDYQTVGTAFGIRVLKCLIADQMGLGKTIQGIGVALGVNQWPILIICPKSLRLNWQKEWDVWTDKKVMIGTPQVMKNINLYVENNMVDVVICNYDSLEKHFVERIEEKVDKANRKRTIVHLNDKAPFFKGVIIDEAHECRNEKIKRYKVVKAVIGEMQMRCLLTGTPIVNNPNDMASLLELLGHLEEFGGRFKFNKRYCGLTKGTFGMKQGEAGNLHELNIKLRSLCMVRREKHQVLNLPEKIRTTHEVELSNRSEYDHAFLSLQDYLAKIGQSQEKIDQAMRAEFIVRLNKLKFLSAVGKIPEFVEFAERMFLAEEKLVVFCWHKEIIRELRKSFPDLLEVSGETNDQQVEINKAKFMNDPKARMIVLTYGRGSVGHTLTASCNYCAIELAWTDAIQSQSEDRIHRIGQKSTTYCHYFLGKDTVDQWIYSIIEKKRSISRQATGSSEEIQTMESDILKAFMKQDFAKV